tara:strand:- start:86 stop:457 length:372 start_codon:yes stop_codon:yes gene_type:complete
VAKEDETLNTYYPLYDDGLYTEVVHESGEKAIKILKGNYKDIIYQYGKVELIPKEDSEIPTINFDRAVRSCPEELTDTISEDEDFNLLMGDILVELIANQGIQEYNYGIQQRVQTEINKRSNK